MTLTAQSIVERLTEAELPQQVKAIGLTRHDGRDALLLITNEGTGPVAFATSTLLPRSFQGLPVVHREIPGRLRAAHYLPAAQTEALTPEQDVLEPVMLGAQVQNGSADARLSGYGVGTLGAFAQNSSGQRVLLSNNHVIAAENSAEVGDDIYQAQRGRGRVVAALTAWVPISLSKPNRSDIACAMLNDGAVYENAFLPLRNRPVPAGSAAPRIGMKVFKVGRTSGLSLGTVTAVAARVPSVGYGIGSAAFEGSLIIEGQGGSTFSAPGDSGSGIYDLRGRLIAFLYAGDGTITLACPAQEALDALEVQLL